MKNGCFFYLLGFLISLSLVVCGFDELYAQAQDKPDSNPPKIETQAADQKPETPKKEFDIGDRQAVDAFSSLEDGTPGDPGETEGQVTASSQNSRAEKNTTGASAEIKHTMNGGTFWKNMELTLAIEGERSQVYNENRFSFSSFSYFEAGRMMQSPGALSILDLMNYSASRDLLNTHFDERLQNFGNYTIAQNFYSPQPSLSLATIYNYQFNQLIFDPHSTGRIEQSYQIDSRKTKMESAGSIGPGWLERWVKDHGPDSAIPTISTVVELGFPLVDKAESGETGTLTLAVLKTFEFGTIIANAFGTSVVGNADRTLRTSIYGGRLGFRHDIEINGEERDYRLNLIGALVHEMSDTKHEQDSNTLELAVQYLMSGDKSVGPGVVIGLDHHKNTPRFTFGMTATF